MIIGYQIIQVVIAPIPGQAVDVANGYVFGPWIGPVLSVTGISLGSILAIWLARRFGRPLIRAWLGARSVATIDRYTGKTSLKYFFLFFLLPGLPDDLLCFALGLSEIPWRYAVPTVIVGRLPGITLAVWLGASGRQLSPVWIAMIATLALSIWWLLIRWLRKRTNRVDNPGSSW